MDNEQIIGIDLGGTQVRAGIVAGGKLHRMNSSLVPQNGSVEEVLNVIFEETEKLINSSVKSIGIGVPSVVDIKRGIVYNAQNIPSWKKVELKDLMEKRFHIPTNINNDANCFALGEKYFGKGKEADSIIGLSIGTGMGAGIIINNRLYAGAHCGAGEFGEMEYLEHNYEYYAAGLFFKNIYKANGKEFFRKAQQGDKQALQAYLELGTHIGNAIKTILYAYDPEVIIIGGSVSNAYTYFEKTMWERIHTFSYPESLKDLRIEVSTLENCGVLGAAALYFDQNN